MSAYVLQADAMNIPLKDESVDCIVTSPPYFALRSYQDGGKHYDGQVGSEPTPQAFLESLWLATEEMARVLKPSGSIFVNLGDKYAGSGGHNNSNLEPPRRANAKDDGTRGERRLSTRRNAPDRYNQATGGTPPKSLMLLPERFRIGCVDRLGLWARQVLIWSKPNGLPESVKDRARRSHEDWVHLTKRKDYFANMDEIREPQTGPVFTGRAGVNREGYVPNTQGWNSGGKGTIMRDREYNPLGKPPSSVWTIATEPLAVPAHLELDHFAAFPTEWPRRLILGWCPPDGIVLDPFGGTGTTAMVARALGRTGISIDLSHDYSRLAKWRVFKSGHGKKAISRTALERQGSLLGGGASE